jgi:hypothetical protein
MRNAKINGEKPEKEIRFKDIRILGRKALPLIIKVSGCGGGIQLAQATAQWRAVLDMKMNHRIT